MTRNSWTLPIGTEEDCLRAIHTDLMEAPSPSARGQANDSMAHRTVNLHSERLKSSNKQQSCAPRNGTSLLITEDAQAEEDDGEIQLDDNTSIASRIVTPSPLCHGPDLASAKSSEEPSRLASRPSNC